MIEVRAETNLNKIKGIEHHLAIEILATCMRLQECEWNAPWL